MTCLNQTGKKYFVNVKMSSWNEILNYGKPIKPPFIFKQHVAEASELVTSRTHTFKKESNFISKRNYIYCSNKHKTQSAP